MLKTKDFHMQPATSYKLPVLHVKKKIERVLSPQLRKKIEEYIMEAADNNRIPCSGAIAIAKSLGANLGDVGMIADEMKIKISKCQLGCF
jgi:hypothetical protein